MVRAELLAGLTGQAALVAALAATTDAGGWAWVAGLGYAAGLTLLLARAASASGTRRLGPADRVTLTRACLVAGVVTLVAESLWRPVPVALLVGIAAVALVLDAVDGRVARSTDTASALGARFDMEVDAFLLLVLSLYVASATGWWWVLAIGAMRYAYWAASGGLSWLRLTLPPRYWRKVVAAVQGIVLTVVAADVLPRSLALIALLAALGMLVESFGRDVVWQWRHHGRDRTTVRSLP